MLAHIHRNANHTKSQKQQKRSIDPDTKHARKKNQTSTGTNASKN